MTAFNAAAVSDIGRVRATNEDATLADAHVIAVADGLGGHRAGEVASRLAVETLRASFGSGGLPELRDAAVAANEVVWRYAHEEASADGMGTTLCAAGLLTAGAVGIVNVGDSRAYMLRDGVLEQVTEDHSVTAELVRSGELTEEEARTHPNRNILTRALGVAPDVEVDAFTVPACQGDRLLLCTDGLFNELDEGAIAGVLGARSSAVEAAEQLVQDAVRAGGHDNVSVVVADFS